MQPAWSATWQEGASGRERVAALAVSEMQGITLAGASDIGFIRGALTVRYAFDGTLRWSDFHSGAFEGTSLLYGNNGELFVGCYSQAKPMVYLIKYDAQGRRQWVAEWEATVSFVRAAHLLPAPADGVYTLGTVAQERTALGSTQYVHSAFVRRHTAQGRVLWTRLFPSKVSAEYPEFRACLHDESHTIYALLTRASEQRDQPPASLIALTPEGKTRWARALAGAIATTASLHRLPPNRLVLVQWIRDERRSFVQIQAFQAQRGTPLWSRNWSEEFSHVASLTTQAGNLVVAAALERKGESVIVLRACSPTGRWLWERVIPTPATLYQIIAAKDALLLYLLDLEQWSPHSETPAGEGLLFKQIHLYHLDSVGRVIARRTWRPERQLWIQPGNIASVRGRHLLSATSRDNLLIACLRPNLSLEWMREYDHRQPGTNLFPQVLLPDGEGGVFVGGERAIEPAHLPKQAWLARFDRAGQLVWSELVEESLAPLRTLAHAPDGGVYAASWLEDAHSTPDLLVVHWDRTGKRLWTRRVSRPNRRDARPSLSLQPDPQQGLYLLTTVWNEVSAHDWLLMCLDADGHIRWQQQFNGVDNGEDRAAAMTVDAEGNLYVAGLTQRARDGVQIALRSYDSAGKLRWHQETMPPPPTAAHPRPSPILTLAIDTRSTLRLLVGQMQGVWQLQLHAHLYRLDGESVGTVEYPVIRHNLRPLFSGCFAPDGSLWIPVYEETHQIEGDEAIMWLKARLQQYAPDGSLQREIPVEIEHAQIVRIHATACQDERTLFTALTARLRPPTEKPLRSARHSWYLIKYVL